MATLIAGGDSFVYGSELKDCWSYNQKNNTANEQASLNTYPALIAKELGWDYSMTLNEGIKKTYLWIKNQTTD